MNKNQRIEKEIIGGTVYTVIAKEGENVKETPLDIVRRLIESNAHGYGEIKRTCCLPTNGGKKVC